MSSKVLLSILFGLGVTFTSLSFACGPDGEGLMPENDVWIPSSIKTGTDTMDEETFNAVLDRVYEIYAPIIESHDKEFIIEREWENGTVNAYAYQEDNNWYITMLGGLARHSAATPDMLALVACHEVGHHLGGFPKKVSWSRKSVSWASNEGQADYFGSSKCMRKYMEQDDNIGIMLGVHVPQIVIDKCHRNFPLRREIVMCMRGAMAGMALADLFVDISPDTSPARFDTPDPYVTKRMIHSHPKAQCRLDTYFAGSLCERSHYANVSDKRPEQGVCARILGFEDGLRPLCWYLPPPPEEEEDEDDGTEESEFDPFQAPKNQRR